MKMFEGKDIRLGLGCANFSSPYGCLGGYLSKESVNMLVSDERVDFLDCSDLYPDQELLASVEKCPPLVWKVNVDPERYSKSLISKTVNYLSTKFPNHEIEAVLVHNAWQVNLKILDKYLEDIRTYTDDKCYSGVSIYEEWPIKLLRNVPQYVQAPLNIFSPVSREYIRTLSAKVVARNVLFQGLLFRNDAARRASEKIGLGKLLEELHAHAEGLGYSLVQLNLAYVIKFLGVSDLVIGADSKEQFDDVKCVVESSLAVDREVIVGFIDFFHAKTKSSNAELWDPRRWSLR